MHDMNIGDWVLILFWLLIYLLPALLAQARQHHNWPAILVANLAVGWTGLGWIACLVWACTWVRREPRPARAARRDGPGGWPGA